MSTTLNFHHATGSWRDRAYAFFIRMVAAFVPRSRRRYLLISSLAPIVLGKQAVSEHYRTLINVSLSLCSSEVTMLLPMLAHECIYTDEQMAKIQAAIGSCDLARNLECMEVAGAIYKVLPAWLLYEQPVDVVADITTLLALRPSLL